MAKFVARHIAPEMLGLLLLEALLAFAVAYCVGLGGASIPPGRLDWVFDERAANEAAVVAVTVGFTSVMLGLYRPSLFRRARSLLFNTAVGGLVAFPAVWAVMSALGMRADWLVGPDRIWPMKMLVLWIGALFAVRLGMLLLLRSKLFVRRVAVAGSAAEVARAVAGIRSSPAGFFEVVGGVHIENDTDPSMGGPARLRARGIRTALMSQSAYDKVPAAVRAAYTAARIELEPEPVFWERHLKRVDIDSLTPAWFANLDAVPGWRLQPVVNRAGDIVLSLGLLMFTLPLMVLMSILVRLDSPGPVLYRQARVGLGGTPFVVLKFRSMKANAEVRGPEWAQRSDPRVTRIGSFMRRTRIDELPQLVNVLKGQMSFIGPRPERPHFVEQLAELIPFYRERTRVKPGLTGWAQVNYPYGASVEDAQAKLSYDLFYVRHRSVLLDLSILVATVRVILFQEGAR